MTFTIKDYETIMTPPTSGPYCRVEEEDAPWFFIPPTGADNKAIANAVYDRVSESVRAGSYGDETEQRFEIEVYWIPEDNDDGERKVATIGIDTTPAGRPSLDVSDDPTDRHPALDPAIDLTGRVLYTLDNDGENVEYGAILHVADRDTLIRLAAKNAADGKPGRWVISDAGCEQWHRAHSRLPDETLNAYGAQGGGQARADDFSQREIGGWCIVSVGTPILVFLFDPEDDGENMPAEAEISPKDYDASTIGFNDSPGW